MVSRYQAEWFFFSVLGLAAIAGGIAGVLVWAGTGDAVVFGPVTIGGDDLFRYLWGGLVVIAGGAMMIAGARRTADLEGYALILCGVLMLWVIAGTDLFAIFCESIPAPEGSPGLFNSFPGFLAGMAPPYPAVLFLAAAALAGVLARRKSRSED